MRRAPTTRVAGTAGTRLWLLFWAALAWVHTTQSIWTSGGAAHPGDLIDARFNHLVLEHGHRSLSGVYAWDSPGLFHPEAGALGLSETHAGTLPIYTAARRLGADPHRAFQAWFLAVTALNLGALARLLRAVRVDDLVAGPCLLLGAASGPIVWLAGTHAQVLPFFPTLFAACALVHHRRAGGGRHLVAALGWGAWQFAASPYLAFFALVCGAPWLFAALARAGADRPPAPADRGRLAVACLFAALAFVAAGLVLGIHLRAMRLGHARPWSEVLDLAPTLAAWITSAPGHWWPRLLPWTGDHTPDGIFLAGFGLLLLFAGSVVGFVVRSIEGERRRWFLAAAAGAVLGAAFFTAPARGEPSVFAWIAAHLEALRAFRASGRFIVLALPLAVVATGLWLSALRAAPGRAGPARLVPLAALVLAAAETLVWEQPRVALEHARARTGSVVRGWIAAGDRPVLAFAPGYSNQDSAVVQLDAWAAALARGRRTLNGYSGGVPGSHFAFRFNPTEAAARDLVAARGLDPDDVSIVTDWDPETARALGIERFADRPVARLAGFALQPAAWSLSVDLETFEIDGAAAHQFTPPAEVVFPLPDGATRLTGRMALRPGAYTAGGVSDGVSILWMLREAGGERLLGEFLLNPRDVPGQRGWNAIDLPLPAGVGRILVLRTGRGPAGDGAWDWPVFADLRAD